MRVRVQMSSVSGLELALGAGICLVFVDFHEYVWMCLAWCFQCLCCSAPCPEANGHLFAHTYFCPASFSVLFVRFSVGSLITGFGCDRFGPSSECACVMRGQANTTHFMLVELQT